MRCPKCGYISFDHIDTCLKCNKNISKVSSKLEGTTYNVAPPSFLKFQSSAQQQESEGIVFDAGRKEYDVVDPDLDVLMDEIGEQPAADDDADIAFGDELSGLDAMPEDESFELDLDGDEDDGVDGLDLGQFEDAFEEQESEPKFDEFELDMPDELSDISDLEAPQDEVDEELDDTPEPMPEELPESSMAMEELSDFSLDLDLDELNEDFTLTDTETVTESDTSSGLEDLSLDDLGLTETEEKPSGQDLSVDEDMNMDADLDFDLDLGGITLDDDK